MTQGIVVDAADHPIKSVTIYKSSKAEVVRTFALDLKPGQSKIEIQHLPSCIEPDSARVTGFGDARLFDVTCVVKRNAVHSSQNSSERIRVLNAELKNLKDEKHIWKTKGDILSHYGQSLTAEHIAPESAMKFFEDYVRQAQKSSQARSELDEQIFAVERQIMIEKDEDAKKKGTTNGHVTVVVSMPSGGPVELKLTYIVTHARWESIYELHASNVNGQPSETVTLNYRARVTQRTGEDWNGIGLVLSTAMSDTVAKGVPEQTSLSIFPRELELDIPSPVHRQYRAPPHALAPIIIQQPVPDPAPSSPHVLPAPYVSSSRPHSPARRRRRRGYSAPSTSESGEDMFYAAPVVQPLNPFAAGATMVSESPLSLTYTVEEQSTVPSDGLAHQVQVATLPFEATTSHVSVPRADVSAYLQCSVKNTSDYRLLPGNVSVFLDGSFVSKTFVKDVAPGDAFECTFGADPSLHITYVRKSKVVKGKSGAFFEAQDETTYTTSTTLKNKHRFALTGIVVRDVVALVPDDANTHITVLLHKPAGLASAKEEEEVEVTLDGDMKAEVRWSTKGGEKEGKYEWLCDLDAGQEMTLEAEFRVRSSAGMHWNLQW